MVPWDLIFLIHNKENFIMVDIYLGLGSNKGDREKNLESARNRLTGKSLHITMVSPVYISEPWGFESDKHFYNQVLGISTLIDAFDLLDLVQETENEMGRFRSREAYSDRLIDIDILFYGTEIISSKPLIIPHPLLHKRMFVLQPLADIAPGFVHPVFNKTISELVAECGDPPLKEIPL